MDKTVTTIPKAPELARRTRVAVYARVSTKAERQNDSLENQIQHYTETIGANPEYELIEIYYDYGISGFKEARPGFQRLMADAELDRFDLVITKAISRFARNAATVLEATRRLKDLGIGVFFELQNINTLSQAGELLMTLYAAFAQAESETARAHTLMALQRRYDAGDPPRQLQRSMGYSKGPDGEFYPDEYAPLVVEMFEMAADGYTAGQITNYLNSQGFLNHNGKRFNRGSVYRMLRNSGYKGDFAVRRYYKDENRKLRKNEGQRTRYYIEGDHIPIVSTDLWDKAQAALDSVSRKAVPTNSQPEALTDQNYPYRRHLFCAECGHRLIRAVRAGRVLWECNGKTKWTKDFCSGVSVTDDEVREHLPLAGDVYIAPVLAKGRVEGHRFTPASEWAGALKPHRTAAPALTEENYPYMNRIFCKYCGSRLRRIINKNNTVTWICDGLSRNGKGYCKGVRIPDEKLRPLIDVDGIFYIGKTTINGETRYGYARRPDEKGA